MTSSRNLALLAALLASTAMAQLNTATYAQQPNIVVETLVIKASGVYPQKIVRPKGPFVLYVENRLPGHAAHFSLTLNQTNASELIGLNTIAAKFTSYTLVDLLPNTYVLHIQPQGTSQSMNSLSQSALSVTIEITN